MRRLPPRIALVGLDEELADYIAASLARHWPAARVQRSRAGQGVAADLAIVDCEPASPPRHPTLWLADIDRGEALLELGPCFWRTPMPTTARRLRRAIEHCLAGVARRS
jgi:hypothetical protein